MSRLGNPFIQTISIDLGTVNSHAAVGGQISVSKFPTVAVREVATDQVVGVGGDALALEGRTSESKRLVIRPIRAGVVTEFEETKVIIRDLIYKTFSEHSRLYQLNRPYVLLAVPTIITEVELMALMDATISAGASKVQVLFEPVAAAVGVGLNILDGTSHCIVDIGGGTTDIVTLANGELIEDCTIPVAGQEIDKAIVDYLEHKYNLSVSELEAERLKIKMSEEGPDSCEVVGRKLPGGNPARVKITKVEVKEAISPTLGLIVDTIGELVSKSKSEVVQDIANEGIYLVGGGAGLIGLSKMINKNLGISVNLVNQPEMVVINGLGLISSDAHLLERLAVNIQDFI